MMGAFLLGAGLGLGAGISPGPLLMLVVTAALERGFPAGLRVALAPLVSDAPVILLTLLVLARMAEPLLVGIGLAGGLFVLYLGIETIRHAPAAEITAPEESDLHKDLWRGCTVNLLSPHPWLFWLGVGSPLLLDLGRSAWLQAFAFLVGFYGLLVGSKVLLAAGIAGGRRHLSRHWYRRLLQGGGLLLVLLGVFLIAEAVRRIPGA